MEGLRAGGSARGVTLIECLVVIAIVGVLSSLALPAAWRARQASDRTVSLSNLRTHSTAVGAYLNDSRSAFPMFGDTATGRVKFTACDGQDVSGPYFVMHALWNMALAEYYDGDTGSDTFWPPDAHRLGETPRSSSYFYSCAFVARPEFWRPQTRRPGTVQYGQTRAAEVMFPSDKALFYNAAELIRFWSKAGAEPRRHELATVDGSARALPAGAVSAGYERGEGVGPGAMHAYDVPPAMHTIGGVRGRDLGR